MAQPEKLTDALENLLPNNYRYSDLEVDSSGVIKFYAWHEEYQPLHESKYLDVMREAGYEIRSIGVTNFSTMIVFRPAD